MENEPEKNISFFRFEDLRVYHKALDYICYINDVTLFLPNKEKENLVTKFNQSTRAIAMNIAEGSSRNKNQFIYYLKLAKSAIRECIVYTTICYGLEYFSDDVEEKSRNELMEMTKMIGALITSLQKTMSPAPPNQQENFIVYEKPMEPRAY
ncbi:MAG: four helix bundle protein [Hyphomicrobiales bacterium]